MELSYKSYTLKCVLGAEVMYFLCLIYGSSFLNESEIALHHSLIELLPGFTWISVSSVLIGAIDIFVYALFFGLYMVWMFNSSFKK